MLWWYWCTYMLLDTENRYLENKAAWVEFEDEMEVIRDSFHELHKLLKLSAEQKRGIAASCKARRNWMSRWRRYFSMGIFRECVSRDLWQVMMREERYMNCHSAPANVHLYWKRIATYRHVWLKTRYRNQGCHYGYGRHGKTRPHCNLGMEFHTSESTDKIIFFSVKKNSISAKAQGFFKNLLLFEFYFILSIMIKVFEQI